MTTPNPIGIRYLSGTPLNPGNVPDPRHVDRRWIWDHDTPATDRQRDAIRRRMTRAGIDERELGGFLGDGFTHVDALSKWAASWAIRELDAFLVETDDDYLKATMARLLRQANPDLPHTYAGGTDD